MEIHESDLLKIRDAIAAACEFHMHRDEMNAQLHLAHTVRMSPLTSELANALDRLESLLQS
jgi:hypothetical protein